MFIWEGVTYYLPEDVIRNTFNFVKTHSLQGSTICFDYVTEKTDSTTPSEPQMFWIKPNELESLLAKLRFESIEHIDSKEMEKRYLTLDDGSLAETAPSQYCFVYAIVST